MDKLSFSAGGVALIVSLILRLSIPKKPNSSMQKNWAQEKRSINALLTLLVMMGVLWIVLGVLLDKTILA